MAIFHCSWDNTTIANNSNVIYQRLSWREKSVGGAFNTTSIIPTNDLDKTVSSVDFVSASYNKVYEFILEVFCSLGGSTQNSNGIVEKISFDCITPTLSPDTSLINFSLNVINTDITKARIVLKLQSDNTVITTQTVNRVGNLIDYAFNGLTSSTGYYFEVELYATVNGVEVVSSDVAYLGEVCGGNIEDYSVSTLGITSTTTTTSTSSTTTTTTFASTSMYFGAKVTGSTPTSGEILAGILSVQDGNSDVTADWTSFNSTPQYLWWAIPNINTNHNKNAWYASVLNNGNMGNPGDLFETISIVNVSGQDYYVGITAYPTQFTTTCDLLKI